MFTKYWKFFTNEIVFRLFRELVRLLLIRLEGLRGFSSFRKDRLQLHNHPICPASGILLSGILKGMGYA